MLEIFWSMFELMHLRKILHQMFWLNCACLLLFKMASKRTHDDSSEENKSKDRNESTATATAISKKKFTGSKMYKVSFKNEWKASYLITEVKHDKYKFHCLPCGKNLTCHHQGLKDVKEHCNKPSYKQADASWRKPIYLIYKEVIERMFSEIKPLMRNLWSQTLLFGISCPLQLLIILHSSLKTFSPIAKLLHHMQKPKQ